MPTFTVICTMLLPVNISAGRCDQRLATYGPSLANFAEKYSKLLSSGIEVPPQEQIYVCPLCTEHYLISLPNGPYSDTEFSEDHVPPQSVAGRKKVLVCKKCNSDAGFYEAELPKLMNFGSVPDKHQSILPDTRLVDKGTGTSFSVSIRRDNNTVDVQFDALAKQHNSIIKGFLGKLHAGKLPSLTIQTTAPDETKITKALLKSAYLLAFIWWGMNLFILFTVLPFARF